MEVLVADSPYVEGTALELWETFPGEVALALMETVIKVISLYLDTVSNNQTENPEVMQPIINIT